MIQSLLQDEPETGWAVRALIDGFLGAFLMLWWFVAIIAAVALVKGIIWIIRARKLARSGIAEIDTMPGHVFEQRLQYLFENLGYSVRRVGSARGDYGGDLVVKKDGVSTIVQAKRWKRNVGVRAVQEAVAARAKYRCDESMLVTNSFLTRQAVHLAQVNKLRVWDRSILVRQLESAKGGQRSTVPVPPMAPVPEESIDTESSALTSSLVREVSWLCATCAKPVSDKVRAFCIDRPERFGGVVYCFDHQRHR